MDATNLVTIAISLVALFFSVFLNFRQIRVASGGNHLPVVLDAFKEAHSTAWLDAEEYVMTKLAKEHAAECGIRGLPVPARTHANKIGLFYDDLGTIVAHDMIDQDLVIGSYGWPIVRLWDALAPYVYEERRAHKVHFWVYFEDLAVRTAERTPEAVYDDIGRRWRPPRQEPDAIGSDLTAPPATPGTPL